jgi:hypothetical protein
MGANSHVLFSQKMRAHTKAEHAWLCKVADRLWGKRAEEEGWPPRAEEFCDVSVDDLVFPDWVELKNGGILVYTNDGASPSAVTPLAQLFIRKFHKNKYWILEWANSSDKPHAGAFGGGAVFVTADRVDWFTTGNWITNKIDNWDHQNG